MAVLTNHGRKRIKERAGLPLKAIQSNAERALKEGLSREDLSGSIRRYADCLYHREEFRGKVIKIYGNMVYIFDRMVLITALTLPSKYMKIVEKIKEKRKKE